MAVQVLSKEYLDPEKLAGVTETVTEDQGVTYQVRPLMFEADLAWIYASWCSQIRRCGFYTAKRDQARGVFREMDKEEFSRHKAHVIEPLVERCGALIAHEKGYPDHFIGWAVGEFGPDKAQVLHFVYVKGSLRGAGVGTRLVRLTLPALGHKPIYVTHWTPACRHFVERWGLRHNPYLVR